MEPPWCRVAYSLSQRQNPLTEQGPYIQHYIKTKGPTECNTGIDAPQVLHPVSVIIYPERQGLGFK